ncbi:T9SS type A sorting domain-containing protein [Fulvivirgaceae bacterium BMA10]|uniref:T9SS type A sorting domain-containing protein n=1 Tax=Splendidivirga corallicola TaxID=3051826 RepID=A0ABT8KNR3_9BACT|nr:T9SS type A sorting domain-containing protein [Fulvivirgaceae bacterium BMA10]
MTKCTLFIIIFSIGVSCLYGQNSKVEYCGTTVSEEDLEYLLATADRRNEIVEEFISRTTGQRRMDFEIPVQFHISRTSSGENPALTLDQIQEAITVLNEGFQPMNISFIACGDPNYLDNTGWHTEFSKDNDDPSLNGIDKPYVLNIYVFPDIDGANGYAKFPRKQEDRIVVESEPALLSTIIHEVGHYFSLLHTYEESRGKEFVDGSNCGIAGDLICDTPPDPGKRDLYENCVYNGNVTDPLGALYQPDGFNYMGRGQQSCRSKFSQQQMSRILASLLMDRYYLINCAGEAPIINCPVVINDFPYTESFEDHVGNSDWIQDVVNDEVNWNWGSSTPSNDTGPDNAIDGIYFMYIEASDANHSSGILRSPCIDLTDQTTASISFSYHMFGEDIATLKFQISVDDGTIWKTIWSESGDKGLKWQQSLVNLDQYVGDRIQLRFEGSTGDNSRGDIALDNIEISNEVITSISEGVNMDVKLFPNPTDKSLSIQYEGQPGANTTVFIIGLDGRVLYKKDYLSKPGINEFSINIEVLRTGIYFLKLINDHSQHMTKFYVIK